LEAHPTIGSRHGKLNAHGKPLNHHVLGICHMLRLDVPPVAEALDIYSPTRLALTTGNLSTALPTESVLAAATERGEPSPSPSATPMPPPTDGAGLSEELDAVLEAADLLYARTYELAQARSPHVWPLWEEAWSAQHLAGAHEAYAVCCADDRAGATHETDETVAELAVADLARALRRRFDASAEWRSGARERRAAQQEAARARRRFAPQSALGSAASALGLRPAELAQLGDAATEALLKERWRELALRAHPDLGGSAERFLELRAAYKVLLRAAGGRA
jgi:hypothetical protein